MARRPRGGLIDDVPDHRPGADPADAIEILDLNPLPQRSSTEVLAVEPSGSGSGLAKLAVAAVGAVVALGVVTAGNTPAPKPPAPSVTIPPTTLPAEEVERAATIAELEATYGVEIGDGPDLAWEPVIWNIGTTEFAWIDDGFVGDNGETEWTIRPSLLGPSIGQRQSLSLEYPGYSVVLVEGARLLLPTVSDHMLVAIGDQDPVRVDFPALDTVATSELIVPVRYLSSGVAVGDRVVIAASTALEIDLEAFSVRVGRDLSNVASVQVLPDRVRFAERDGPLEAILFDDVGLTPSELTDLGLVDNWVQGVWSADVSAGAGVGGFEPLAVDDVHAVRSVTRTDTGAALTWYDETGQLWLSTSTDGEVWSTGPLMIVDTLSFSGPRLYDVATDDSRSIRRSPDQGRTWQSTFRPFEQSVEALAIDDVLVVLRSPSLAIDSPSMSLEVDDYDVEISAAGRLFELIDRSSGETVFRGTIDDSASGVAFDPFGAGLAISDPETGDELLSVPQGALLRAFAEAGGAESAELAVTRWEVDQDDPEWRIEPLIDVFHDAVDAVFVPGDGHLLAVVTTSTGTNFYVAETAR